MNKLFINFVQFFYELEAISDNVIFLKNSAVSQNNKTSQFLYYGNATTKL